MEYRFFLTGRSGTREVFPTNNRTLDFSFSKGSNRSDFTRELEGSIILIGDDFHWIYDQEKLVYRCDLVNIKIHKKCNGIWNEDWFEGDISLNSGIWNLEKCTVELNIKKFDRYQCYDDHADEEINVLQNVVFKRNVYPKSGNIETQSFSQYIGPGQQFDWFPGEPNPESKGWAILERRYIADAYSEEYGSGSYSITWVRETKYSSIPLQGWINLGGTRYARTPILYDKRIDPYNPSSPNSWGETSRILQNAIDNGMLLFDVFEMFISNICPGLTVESDFFQWNPEIVSQVNYVTGQESKVRNLVLFQKSDVKRPFDTGNAAIAEINFKDLLEDICNIYQLEWEITEDDKFKIEHVSYKNRILAIDTTVGDNFILNKGNRLYSYDNDEIPKREVFTWMDDTSFGDFKAAPILYTNSCAGNGENEEVSYQIKNITTDMIHCLNNPASDSKVVNDEGFVLIACADDFSIIREASLRGGNTVNNSLAWSQLHHDYWRHNRPLLNFRMNNQDTLAVTVKPTKVQDNIKYRICCASDFDKDNLIKTFLGDNGILKSATFNLYKEILEMTVLFPAEGDLTDNDPPFAVDDTADTFVNIPVKIDVLANDTDDSIIVPSTLELMFNVQNGTAEITDDWQVLFTPSTGFIGIGVFYYRVRDNYGEVSNTATVTININEGTPVPEANGTSFVIAKNLELSKGPGALTVNDTAPTPITVLSESKISAQGGTVIINSNGSFSYAPAADYLGPDSFSYTIQDNYGNQSTGLISITVFEPLTVYVVLEKSGIGRVLIEEDCGEGIVVVGSIERADYHLNTFSDSAKTIPLDVDGYNLKVKLKQNTTYFNPTSTYEYPLEVSIPSGSSYLYGENIIVYLDYMGCGNGDIPYPPGTNFEIEITLQPGDGYEI